MHLFDAEPRLPRRPRHRRRAHAARHRRRPSPSSTAAATRCAVCFFGEAAVNNGAFHEALNMAGALEAARRSSSARTTATAWARRSSARRAVHDISERGAVVRHAARSRGRPGRARGARRRCERAVERARANEHADAARGAHLPLHGPLDVRRRARHYRTKEEVEEHRKRDPIMLLAHAACRSTTG